MAATFAAVVAISSPSFAQTQPDPHHPQPGSGTVQTMPNAQQPPGMMMPMGEMMQMMGQMMQMMGGGQMGMGGPGMSGMATAGTGMAKMGMPQMGMADHFEGRVAFLRAELNITKPQEKAWNDFVAALHSAAGRIKDSGVPMMPAMANGDLPARLEAQEKLLGARLDGSRDIQAALAPLYAALTEDQRKLADDLLVGPMGFMGPGMMPAGMPQGGMMQGGMSPGSMMPAQQ
jgi:hypothetical protein